MTSQKLKFTRREFLRGNIFLAALLAISGFPLTAVRKFFRRERQPNVSDKEARFYSRLAG